MRPRFDAYKAVSAEIRAVFEEHTPLIEPVALDEAYLDVTENLKGLPTATEVARDIRAMILARTGLVASAGVSYNKFLAKVASDHRKPDALFVITPAMGPSFVEALPIGQFRGVGPATEAKMQRLGIQAGITAPTVGRCCPAHSGLQVVDEVSSSAGEPDKFNDLAKPQAVRPAAAPFAFQSHAGPPRPRPRL